MEEMQVARRSADGQDQRKMSELVARVRESVPEPGEKLQSLVTMESVPIDPFSREQIGSQMWDAILFQFKLSLDEEDRRAWDNPPPHGRVERSPKHLQLLKCFDLFLLDKVSEWGFPLLFSARVLQRIADWQRDDPELLERFGEMLVLKSRIMRGEAKASLRRIAEFENFAVPELELLLALTKKEFGERHGAPNCARMAAWMRVLIESRPQQFAFLLANVEVLIGFLNRLPDWKPDEADKFTHGRMRAQGFFNLWVAATHNRSPKDVKNKRAAKHASKR